MKKSVYKIIAILLTVLIVASTVPFMSFADNTVLTQISSTETEPAGISYNKKYTNDTAADEAVASGKIVSGHWTQFVYANAEKDGNTKKYSVLGYNSLGNQTGTQTLSWKDLCGNVSSGVEVYVLGTLLSIVPYSEDVTVSFKSDYTPTAGDTIAKLKSNLVTSDSNTLNFEYSIFDEDLNELTDEDVLVANVNYCFVSMVSIKDNSTYEFSYNKDLGWRKYNGNVSILGTEIQNCLVGEYSDKDSITTGELADGLLCGDNTAETLSGKYPHFMAASTTNYITSVNFTSIPTTYTEESGTKVLNQEPAVSSDSNYTIVTSALIDYGDSVICSIVLRAKDGYEFKKDLTQGYVFGGQYVVGNIFDGTVTPDTTYYDEEVAKYGCVMNETGVALLSRYSSETLKVGDYFAVYKIDKATSKTSYDSDITLSFSKGYTPTVGDTIADLRANLTCSDSDMLAYDVAFFTTSSGELADDYTLKAGDKVYVVPIIRLKDNSKYCFDKKLATYSDVYTGNVTILGKSISNCRVGDYDADNKIMIPNSKTYTATKYDSLMAYNCLEPDFDEAYATINVSDNTPNNEVSLTTKDSVDINFYLDVKYYTTDANATVEVTYNHNNTTYTENRTTDSILASALPVDEEGRCKLTIESAPAQLTEVITVKILDGSGNVVHSFEDYSMKKYCQSIIDRNLDAKGVCKALIDYAAAAQTYFDYNTSNMATTSFADDFDDVTYNSVKDQFSASLTGDLDLGITSVTLMSLSNTQVRFYCPFTEESIKNYSISIETDENWYGSAKPVAYFGSAPSGTFIGVKGIASTNLDNEFTITVTDNSTGKSAIIKYKAINYCILVLNNDTISQNLKTLAKAIILYNRAAQNYFVG